MFFSYGNVARRRTNSVSIYSETNPRMRNLFILYFPFISSFQISLLCAVYQFGDITYVCMYAAEISRTKQPAMLRQRESSNNQREGEGEREEEI